MVGFDPGESFMLVNQKSDSTYLLLLTCCCSFSIKYVLPTQWFAQYLAVKFLTLSLSLKVKSE